MENPYPERGKTGDKGWRGDTGQTGKTGLTGQAGQRGRSAKPFDRGLLVIFLFIIVLFSIFAFYVQSQLNQIENKICAAHPVDCRQNK